MFKKKLENEIKPTVNLVGLKDEKDSQDKENKTGKKRFRMIFWILLIILGNIFIVPTVFLIFEIENEKSLRSEDLGILTIEDEIGFSEADPRIIIARTINIITFFNVLIFILFIIYSIILLFNKAKRKKAKKILKRSIVFLIILLICWGVARCVVRTMYKVAKPVIYLYPTQKQETLVQLDFQGKLIADYPDYNYNIGGWRVTAYPDGKIINHADNREYSYLFWEGQTSKKINYNLNEGFIVAGKDTEEFLQNKLAQIGLTPKEYNEFIVYWYPYMKNNKYNLIHFAKEKYTDTAPLTITPKPEAVLRVFMVYKALNKKIKIQPQEFEKFQRTGFTVVEWGGTEVN